MAIFHDFSVLAPKNYLGPSPHLGFPRYCLVNFHENPFSRSRERLPGIFVADGKSKKKQKTKKTSVKHIRIRAP